VELCEHKKIYVGDEKKSSSQLVKILTTESFSIGLNKLLQSLTRDQLKYIAAKMEWEDDKIPHNKQILVKRLHEELEKVGPKKYLENFKSEELEPLLKTLLPKYAPLPSKSKYVETFIDEANEIGLENLFSSFPPKKLQEIADACGLTVNSSSIEVLIDCILNQEDHEPPKKKKPKTEKPSKKKPAIKKGISKVDLFSHYYRDELFEYCKEHGLKTQGNKKDFVSRILLHVEGKPQAPEKVGKGKRKRNANTSEDDEKNPPKKARKSEPSESEDDKGKSSKKAKKPKKDESEKSDEKVKRAKKDDQKGENKEDKKSDDKKEDDDKSKKSKK